MIVTMSEGDFTGGQLKVSSCVVVAKLYIIDHIPQTNLWTLS